MEITIEELLQITTLLLKYLERKGYQKINFSNDNSYYQKIWHQDRNLTETPNVTLGFLDEDIESLKLLLKGDPPTNYELERLGAVLTVMGAILK